MWWLKRKKDMSGDMSGGWNYRIVRHPVSVNKPHKEEYYSLREVYYDSKNNPTMMSSEPRSFVSDNPLEIIQSLKRALDSALQHPVLDDPWPDDE